MADGTRISKLDKVVQKPKESYDRQQQTFECQQQILTELIHRISAIDRKYEEMFQEWRKKREDSATHTQEGQQNHNQGGGIQA